MAFVTADRVKETTTTTGTGNITLAGAVSGFRTFGSVCANGDICYYAIVGGTEWEVGQGTWSTGGTLARSSVIASSNAGSQVDFAAGTKDVFLTAIASRTIQIDDNGRTIVTEIKMSLSGQTVISLANPYINAVGSVNNYMQAAFQNKSAGTTASSDIVLTTDTGTDSAEYADFGINGSGFSGANWGAAKDGYLYVEGGASGVGYLHLGTGQANTKICFHVGGGGTANEVAHIDGLGGMLMKSVTSDAAAPAAGWFRIYPKTVAGRIIPKYCGPSGVDSPLQPALYQNRVVCWTPGTATLPNYIGQSPTLAATCSHPAVSTGGIGVLISRAQFATSTTAGNAAGLRGAIATFLIGDATNRGGFFFVSRFHGGTLHTTGRQVMVGMSSSVSALAGEPSSSMNDFCGVCLDSTDGTWQFSRRTGSGTATKVSLGVAAAANQVFELIMFCKPGDATLYVKVVQIGNDGSGTVLLDTSYNTVLPAVTTLLAPHFQVRNGALAAAHNIGLNKLYVEADV
jgi:hypothetical protein